MRDLLLRYPLLAPLAAYLLGILQARGRWAVVVFLLLTLLLAVDSLVRPPKNLRFIFYSLFFLLGLIRTEAFLRAELPGVMREWVQKKQEHQVLLKAEGFCQGGETHSFFDGEMQGYYLGEVFRPLKANLRWYVGSPRCVVSPGRYYRTQAKFSLPRRFGNPSAFDYPFFLRAQGIFGSAWIAAGQWLVPLAPEPSWRLWLRQQCQSLLERAKLSPEIRQVFQGILWGERPAGSSGLASLFRATGLAHILVVSGLHLGLVFTCAYLCLYLAGAFFPGAMERNWVAPWARVSALGCTVVFVLVAGPAPPVIRALGMLVFLVVVTLMGERRDWISLGLLAAWIMLLWRPLWAFHVSFQLSFLAVLILVLLGRRLGIGFGKSKISKVFLGIPLATVTVNGALYPLLASQFHQVSLVAPLANALALPCFSFLLLPGLLFAQILNWFFPSAALALLKLLGMVAQWLVGTLKLLASWHWATAWVGPPGVGCWLLWILATILFLFAKRRAGFLISLALWASLGWLGRVYPSVRPTGLLRLNVLDVGQGEALLLELPQGSAILIDGGGIPYGELDIGERVVLPELLRRGIRRLKAMALTHPDGDHALGLTALARHLEVEEFWVAAPFGSLEDLPELKKVLEEKSVPIRYLDNRHWLFSDQVAFKILWPPPESDIANGTWSKNDRSLVIQTCYAEICMLLTGDLERAGESGILERGETIRSQILKVGHHGSRTSSSEQFLRAVSPRWALISAGQDNRFGMPHAEVLRRLGDLGVEVFRTDREGLIQVGTDGKNILTVKPGPGGPTPNY